MVEYVTKEEVYDILNEVSMTAMIDGKQDAVDAAQDAIKKVKKLYAVRSNVTSCWKTLGMNREAIFCGNCGFKTMAYKNSLYCPNCGRTMLNGVKR